MLPLFFEAHSDNVVTFEFPLIILIIIIIIYLILYVASESRYSIHRTTLTKEPESMLARMFSSDGNFDALFFGSIYVQPVVLCVVALRSLPKTTPSKENLYHKYLSTTILTI